MRLPHCSVDLLMLLNAPSLIYLSWRVRRALSRDGFAATLARFPGQSLQSLQREHGLSYALACARFLRRVARLEQRLPNLAKSMLGKLPASACLDQAITLRFFLHAKGYPVELKIGTQRDAFSAFRAHAWIELEGVAIGERSSVAQEHRVFEAPL